MVLGLTAAAPDLPHEMVAFLDGGPLALEVVAGYLVVGDVVRGEIEGVGAIENGVIDEPADTATA